MSSREDPAFPLAKPPLWLVVLRILALVLVGVFLASAHDDNILGPFHGLLGLVGVVLLVPVDSARRAALGGWLIGLGYFGWTLRWIVEPFLVDLARHGWMAPFAIILMAGGLALFWALGFGVARWLGTGKTAMLWLPVTLTAAELARGHVFTGFPWGLVSYTMIGSPADVWFAWVGSYGATFLMLVVAVAVVFAMAHSWKVGVPVVAAVVAATFGLAAASTQTVLDTGTTVRIVQPNAPQHQKWDRDWMPVFFDRAIALTFGGAPADVVIWPETSIPALLDYAQPWMEQMSIAARGAPVVAGIQRREGTSYFNSAVLIDSPDSLAAISDKAHLAPFGEYIPLAWLLEPLGMGTLVDQVAGFSAGEGDGLIEVAGLGVVRVLICYEGVFPEEIQRGEKRADVLMIITNDAWFGNGPGPRQHLVQAQARAIETGLPVIRAANTGISAVIDPLGKITAQLPLNDAGALDALVPAAIAPTFYARMGDWPLAVLLGVFMLAGLARRRPIVVDDTQPQG